MRRTIRTYFMARACANVGGGGIQIKLRALFFFESQLLLVIQ